MEMLHEPSIAIESWTHSTIFCFLSDGSEPPADCSLQLFRQDETDYEMHELSRSLIQWYMCCRQEMDASKLRLRRQIPTGGESVLPLHTNSGAAQSLSPPGLGGPGNIHNRQKRLRRRTRLKAALQTCLKAVCATLVSGSLSLMLLPFSWTQGESRNIQNSICLLLLSVVIQQTLSNAMCFK